jgi:hypothetical protein
MARQRQQEIKRRRKRREETIKLRVKAAKAAAPKKA